MKIFDETEEKDIVIAIVRSLEKESGSKIFTMRISEEDKTKQDEIKVLAVFENKEILDSVINVQNIDGKLGVRIRGNYI